MQRKLNLTADGGGCRATARLKPLIAGPAPGAAEAPCASRLASAGREPNSLSVKDALRVRTPARARSRLRGSAAATGPNFKSNTGYRKARYSCVGWIRPIEP